jgi:predicted P-loop ATPase
MIGVRNADIDHVKAMLSRTYDRARKAYGHCVSEVPRQFIFIGTKNPEHKAPYLKDQTGNRRFWPVETSVID